MPRRRTIPWSERNGSATEPLGPLFSSSSSVVRAFAPVFTHKLKVCCTSSGPLPEGSRAFLLCRSVIAMRSISRRKSSTLVGLIAALTFSACTVEAGDEAAHAIAAKFAADAALSEEPPADEPAAAPAAPPILIVNSPDARAQAEKEKAAAAEEERRREAERRIAEERTRKQAARAAAEKAEAERLARAQREAEEAEMLARA